MAIIRMKYTLLDEIARYATGHLPRRSLRTDRRKRR